MNNQDNKSGNSITLLVHAVIWAAGLLGAAWVFRGEQWMKDAIPFLALAYVLVNGALICMLPRRRQS